MWQADSLIVSNKTNKYQIQNNNYNDPSLFSPEVSTHWLVHRDRGEDTNTNVTNIKDFMDLTEIHGFHYQKWNPQEYYWNPQIYKDFTDIYQNVQNNLNM